MHYLDFNATSPYSPRVEAYIKTQMLEDWANPSSEHDAGFRLKRRLSDDRSLISDFLNCSNRCLFFTSGATESISTVLSPDTLEHNGIKHIITTKAEHHATLHRAEYLAKKGIQTHFIGLDHEGSINLSELEKLCQKFSGQAIISILWVNNETGVISPIGEIAKLAHHHACLLHVDAVQALGKIQINLEIADVDFASFSGHKIGSLKGLGVLYAKNPKNLQPLIHGGGQESGIRPGTSNYPAIHSLRLAIEDINWNEKTAIELLKNDFENRILERFPKFKINCASASRIFNTTNLYLAGFSSRAALLQFSRQKIFVSTGSACSSGAVEPSHVITALGYDKDYANSCIRISLGHADVKPQDLVALFEKIDLS